MDEHRDRQARDRTSTTLKRRGILAAGGAALAAIVAKHAAEPVAAANPPLLLNQDNPSTATTSVTTSGSVLIGMQVNNSGGNTGFDATGANIGVSGTGSSKGVSGTGGTTGAYGSGTTYGVSGSGPTGVYGSGTSYGLYGIGGTTGVYASGTSYGLYSSGGTTAVFASGTTYGLYGSGSIGVHSSGTSIGVDAHATGAGTAVNAGADSGPAVNAGSGGNHGVSGTTAAAHYAGVIGYTSTPTASGIGGIAYDPGAFAASFTGTVAVTGTLVVNGVVKSATGASGALRLLSSVESPEPWVEDFGEGTLSGSKAEIALDPNFAAVVDTANMHVFLTPHGPQHLHVPQRTAAGFTVVATPIGEAQTGGSKRPEAAGAFSYRVVAKRKGSSGERLTTWTPPAPLPKPPPVSPASKPPDPPR